MLTAQDVAHLNAIPCIAPVKQPDGSMCRGRDIPILCEDRVRHVGDAIAFIVEDGKFGGTTVAPRLHELYKKIFIYDGTVKAEEVE